MINRNRNYPYIDVIGMRLDIVQIPDVINCMSGWIENKEQGNYIVVASAHDAIFAKKDKRVRDATNNSSLSIPDGISLILLARLRGYSLKKRVYGPDLMLKCLKLLELKRYSHFFYGATLQTLSLLVETIKARFPRLKVAGIYAPPFGTLSQEEDKVIIEIINNSTPDIVWVGLGCPKQQLWMYEHKDKLKIPVMVGVGAAFDFLSGTKPQAPKWIRDNGFEWLFRLVTEPKRLWRRYLINGSQFLFYAGREVILNLFKNSKNPNV